MGSDEAHMATICWHSATLRLQSAWWRFRISPLFIWDHELCQLSTLYMTNVPLCISARVTVYTKGWQLLECSDRLTEITSQRNNTKGTFWLQKSLLIYWLVWMGVRWVILLIWASLMHPNTYLIHPYWWIEMQAQCLFAPVDDTCSIYWFVLRILPST